MRRAIIRGLPWHLWNLGHMVSRTDSCLAHRGGDLDVLRVRQQSEALEIFDYNRLLYQHGSTGGPLGHRWLRQLGQRLRRKMS